jgi:hypothetical protein
VKDSGHPPPHALSIQRAFLSVGVALPVWPASNDIKDDTVVIAISSHPFEPQKIPPEFLKIAEMACGLNGHTTPAPVAAQADAPKSTPRQRSQTWGKFL